MTQSALTNKALQLLAEGLKEEFAQSINEDDKFVELLMEKANQFVAEQIPFTDEEAAYDLGLLLFERLLLTTH